MKRVLGNLTRFEKILWLCSVVIIVAGFLMVRSDEWLTLVASLVGVTALIYVAKGYVAGQILTIIFSIIYAIISYKLRYFGEMITYVGMTAPIALLSVITWIRNPYNENEVKISHVSKKTWLYLVLATVVVTFIFYFILDAFNTANMLFSTISIATSFGASSLMMLRSPYYAVVYAANDVVLIVLWVMAFMLDTSYLPMIVCFVIFFINDIYGFHNWKVMRRNQEKE